MSCKNGCDRCQCGSSAKGERGLTGAQGVQGVPGPAGPAGGGIGNKFNFFEEYTDDQPMTNATFYHPPGYEILSWTNTTGAQIILMAHAVAQSTRGQEYFESDDVDNDVEVGLIKTVLAVDSYTYTHHMRFDLRGGNFDALFVPPTAGVPLQIVTPLAPRQLTTDENNPTEFRFAQSLLSQSAPLMKKVILQNNETISLKFRSKGSGSILTSAQLFLQQLDM
jgi:hypothetical protein